MFVAELRKSTVALATQEANEQHYEVPADFYEFCLGHHRKYSSGYWPQGVTTLDASEDAAFELLAQRAQLQDGQRILDLGCGWGSFTLWALERYPKVQVTCISNSFSQAKHIKARAEAMGASHRLNACTADVNVFQTDKDAFDRVVSIEMFEHVRNYETLLARVRTWLKPGGKLFVHVFSHKTTPWFYDEGWMAENFFTNGQMPSDDLFLHFQKDLTVKDKWFMNGTHYARTCEAWLAKMDAHTDTVRELMSQAYQFPGADSSETTKKLVDWRLFYLACAEMFAYKNGEEWGVSHYVFERTH
jgi:cyclopropane-fatty-acyl-phospholipid synthase